MILSSPELHSCPVSSITELILSLLSLHTLPCSHPQLSSPTLSCLAPTLSCPLPQWPSITRIIPPWMRLFGRMVVARHWRIKDASLHSAKFSRLRIASFQSNTFQLGCHNSTFIFYDRKMQPHAVIFLRITEFACRLTPLT